MPIPFELILEQTPVSYQTRRKRRRGEWQRDVKSAAKQVWGSESPVTYPVMVTITYFFVDDKPADVDNIPKSILDALKGVVFVEDAQVYDLLCRKRDAREDLTLENTPQKLLDILANPRATVHIKIEAALELEVAFC